MLVDVRTDRNFQKFLDAHEQKLHVAMVPILATGMRQALSGTKTAESNVVSRGKSALVAHYKRVYRAVFSSVARPRVAKQEDDGEDNGGDGEGMTDFMSSQLDFIEKRAGDHITTIASNLIDDVRNAIADGVQAGKSNAQITRDLTTAIPGLARDRAAVIARTETHASAMNAMFSTLDSKNIEVKTKRWWAAQDSRTRQSHADMHDTAVPRNEPFHLDGGDVLYPGDDSLGADPSELINCRCAVLYETSAAPALDEGE